MKPQKKPIHIDAKKKDIAPLVLLPGDPLRAKYIADNFLSNVKLVNTVRNMNAYTGTYKGKKISVVPSGMGVASAGIYVFELLYYFGVKKIIRIGTCGAVSKDLKLLDVVLADQIYSETDYDTQFLNEDLLLVKSSDKLNSTIKKTADDLNIPITIGTTNTTSVFGPYGDSKDIYKRVPKDVNIIAEEMEGFAVCLTAKEFNADAAVLLSVTDSPYIDEVVSNEDRQTALNDMIKLALESIIKK